MMKYQLDVKLITLPKAKVIEVGYSANVHKRRREFRRKAKELRSTGGSTGFSVSLWALHQARYTR